MGEMVAKPKMEIYLSSGMAIQVDETFEEIMSYLDANVIDPNDFIIFKYQNGCRMAVIKKEIISISEYIDE